MRVSVHAIVVDFFRYLLLLWNINAIITICFCNGGAMYMDIGKEIKDIRVKSLLSQADFAKELSVSFSTVNRWENGKAIPNFKALKKIREFCTRNEIDFNVDVYISE